MASIKTLQCHDMTGGESPWPSPPCLRPLEVCWTSVRILVPDIPNSIGAPAARNLGFTGADLVFEFVDRIPDPARNTGTHGISVCRDRAAVSFGYCTSFNAETDEIRQILATGYRDTPISRSENPDPTFEATIDH